MIAPITGISSMATRAVLAELARDYDQLTGCPVSIEAMGGVHAARRIRAGEVTDVVVLASNVMQQLEAEGRIVRESLTPFAKSSIAMAVRSGGARPASMDETSVKQAMLGAGKVGYSTGPSGQHLEQLWARWGIAELMSERAVQAPPGVPVAALLAQGQVEIGFQQMSELLGVPGIDIVGPLPPSLQLLTVFSAGVCALSSRKDEAKALLDYLGSPVTEDAKRKYGLEPNPSGRIVA